MVNLFLRARRQCTVTRGISGTADAARIWSSVVDKQAAFAASHKAEQVGVYLFLSRCSVAERPIVFYTITQKFTQRKTTSEFRLLIVDRKKD